MASASCLEEVTTLTGHSAPCWSVAFHPHRPLIASCSTDKSIRLYGFNRSLQPQVFQHLTTLPSAHNRTIRQVAFSPDGRRMASASFDSTVGIWERMAKDDQDSDDDENGGGEASGIQEEWENVGSLEGHESEVKSVAWSSDGSLLATCGRDKSVWIWDSSAAEDDFECLAVSMDHTQDVKHVTFSPKEEILASSSYDDTVKLYASDYTSDEWAVSHCLPPEPPKHYHFPNAPEPEADESGTGHGSTVWCSAFSPCGNYVATCSDDLTIKIWARFMRKGVGKPGGAFRIGRTEREGWYCAATLRGYHERTIFSLDWTEAGNWTPEGLQSGEVALGRLASVGGDGKLCIFGVVARPAGEATRNGFTVHHILLGAVEQAHDVYDLNNVQWCRLGAGADAEGNEGKGSSAGGDDMEHDLPSAGRQGDMWREARNILATAGDDGHVKVWRFGPSSLAPSRDAGGASTGAEKQDAEVAQPA